MVKLSIIIPYFETYELTCRLLRKLVPQLNDEVEVILIDDGCFENGLDKYKEIMVLHQENVGVAKTRNRGWILSRGKYVAFIDCDDMVSDNYVGVLLKAIDKYDDDVINFNWVDMTTGVEIHKPDNYAPWKAIYKRDRIPKFLETYEYGHEDVPFQEEIVSGKYSIVYLDVPLYYYNSHRVGSLIWKKEHQNDICDKT